MTRLIFHRYIFYKHTVKKYHSKEKAIQRMNAEIENWKNRSPNDLKIDHNVTPAGVEITSLYVGNSKLADWQIID